MASTTATCAAEFDVALCECDMLQIVKDVVEQLSVDRSRIVIQGEPVKRHWSPEALRRATENLITNAINDGDASAPVTIAVSAMHERVVVSIHNEGTPIPVSEQESIFQLYRRSEAAKVRPS